MAFIVIAYRNNLATNPRLRKVTIALFVLAFATAAEAGAFGALITKAAPVS